VATVGQKVAEVWWKFGGSLVEVCGILVEIYRKLVEVGGSWWKYK